MSNTSANVGGSVAPGSVAASCLRSKENAQSLPSPESGAVGGGMRRARFGIACKSRRHEGETTLRATWLRATCLRVNIYGVGAAPDVQASGHRHEKIGAASQRI